MSKLTFAPPGFRGILPAPLPNLIVTSVTSSPSTPTAGDHVVFTAVVKNVGLGPTSGDIGILFKVDGSSQNWTTVTGATIQPGGTLSITATNGVSGANYWSATSGSHKVAATVNDTYAMPETDITDNALTTTLSVAAASSSSSSGVLYGPDGTEWAPNTVSDGTNFNVTVNSVSGLLSAIAAVTTAQANAGYRIGIADGLDLAPTSALTIPQNSALDAATQGILVRAVTPGKVKATNGINVSCSNMSLAYCDLYGNFHWQTSPKNTWLLRCHGIGSANFNVSSGTSDSSVSGGSDCGIVGCVYPDGPTSSLDRIHISPSYSGSGHTPGHAMHNFSVIRSWIEGMPLPSGSTAHADMVQIDGLTGTFLAKNSYFGPAGNNGNPQAKADIFWSADAPFCTTSYDTCLLAGAYVDGQGNASNQSGPHRATSCVFYDVSSSMAFRFNSPLVDTNGASTTPDCVLTGCTFYGSINGSGTGLTVNSPTYLSASGKSGAKPAVPSPPWQWW